MLKKYTFQKVKHNSHFLLKGESIQLKVQISWSSFSSCTTGCENKKQKTLIPQFIQSSSSYILNMTI